MCSLQLVRVGSNGLQEGAVHVHKVQLWHWQRSPLSCSPISSKTYGSLRGKILMQNEWSIQLWRQLHAHACVDARIQRSLKILASSSLIPRKEAVVALTQFATAAAARILKTLKESQLFLQCAPPIALTIFAMWGLVPLARFVCQTMLQKDDCQWRDSQTRNILTLYLRPLLLWTGVILICRAFDPLVLSTEASQAIKQRFLNFVRSLSTVLAFAYCSASLSQQLQKVMLDRQGGQNTRSVGAEFVGNTVYTAVWIAAVCLFMELLGFSTQKWLTAGGLGTVLLTLAGREIFTNFLSSIMIHATRPFIVNEWIQTKIEGYEVSGTVEHVGWWSPTIVRGDDREAVHIPNHKFTVSVVRNLSQKSHWRIKTHFGISHLDVSKITSIVADMRKVLSKHPQVEQRRLHRRVFFDNIDPENQALMVLVSCFVKTPHFEEYLRVKETILLDLLKVISHHHARLATPIRSVQRLSDDTDSRSAPFRDMSRSAETYGRPYLLVEATAVTNGRDTDQPSSVTMQTKDGGTAMTDVSHAGIGTSECPVKDKEATMPEEKSESGGLDVETVSSQSKPQLEGLDSMGLNSKDITLLGAAFEKPPANIAGSGHLADVSHIEKGEKVASKSQGQDAMQRAEKSSKLSDQGKVTGVENSFSQNVDQPTRRTGTKMEVINKVSAASNSVVGIEEMNGQEGSSDSGLQTQVKAEGELCIETKRPQVHGLSSTASKQETDRILGGVSSTNKPQLEENLVLGVALDGPKRTLPLNNEVPFPDEQKELVGSRNGNPTSAVKERREGRESSQSSNAGPPDPRER